MRKFKLQDWLPAGTYTSQALWSAYFAACDTLFDAPDGKRHGYGSYFREAFCALSKKHRRFFEAKMLTRAGDYPPGSIEVTYK